MKTHIANHLQHTTALQSALVAIAPSICLSTIWTPDEAPDWSLFEPGNALDDQNPDAWQCWQSEVRACAIIGGAPVTGSEYMGGTWEKYGDNPAESNPTISGYEPQMAEEALNELAVAAAGHIAAPNRVAVLAEIGAALAFVAQFMADEHAARNPGLATSAL